MVINEDIMTIDNSASDSIPETLSFNEEETNSISSIKRLVPVYALISIIQVYEVKKIKNRNNI